MANYSTCKQCGAPLHSDDIAIYQKLVFRGATEFLCIDCLALYFDTTRKVIEDRIDYYRKSGHCALFR